MTTFSVHLMGGADDEKATFSTEYVGRDCRLVCNFRDQQATADAPDFFAALEIIRRRKLEPLGLIPFCYGASLNVWPSGMARDMGSGMSAYVISPGETATRLVKTFDEGPDVIPSSVENQEQFARDWFASLRK